MHLATTETSCSPFSDAEVFRTTDQPTGLGFFDSTRPVLDIELNLTESRLIHTAKDCDNTIQRGNRKVQSVQVRIQQDLGALKSRKGDTGES